MKNIMQTWEEPIGEINYSHEAEITNDGILIDEGICLLEWAWIDAARAEFMSQKIVILEKKIHQLESQLKKRFNPKELIETIQFEMEKKERLGSFYMSSGRK